MPLFLQLLGQAFEAAITDLVLWIEWDADSDSQVASGCQLPADYRRNACDKEGVATYGI